MTVYVLCPDVRSPAGGVKKLYDHVDILNAATIDAAIVHSDASFRAGWFPSETRVVSPPIDVGPGDVLAVPEIYNAVLSGLPRDVPWVSINQNAYNTFGRGRRWSSEPHPYESSRELISVMVISENNRQYVQNLFPRTLVQRVHYGFDPAVFFHSPGRRSRRLVYLPRKRRDESAIVLAMLDARNALEGWEITRIEHMDQAEVATALRQAALFLSFSEREGCPMPPTEALACGCFVLGFDGFGGREYFHPAYTTRVEDGDLVAYAETAARYLAEFEWDDSHELRAAQASRYVLDKYSLERERDEVSEFYSHALEVASRSPAAGRLDDLPLLTPSMPRVIAYSRRLARKAAHSLSRRRP